MEIGSISERQTGRQKDTLCKQESVWEALFAAKVRVQEIVGALSISARAVGDITSCRLPTNRLRKFCFGGADQPVRFVDF